MSSIEEIKSSISTYKLEYEKINRLREKVENIANELDLNELTNMSFDEIKETISIIKFYCNKEVLNKINEIKQKKKANLYPEINSVHYYPEIKEMSWLSEEDQINLDKKIKDCRISNIETDIEEESLNFLINKEILEKRYIFKCFHNSWDCGEEAVTEKRFNELKEYWKKESKGKTTQEDDEQYHYGCFEVPCAYDRCREITNLKEFEDEYSYIQYVRIKKPDLTLDKL